MDERTLEALQQQMAARSWLYPDPASHTAGVEDTVVALRKMLEDQQRPIEPHHRAPVGDHRVGTG